MRVSYRECVAYATVIGLSLWLFQAPKNQGLNWTFPYFSGAANLSESFEWRISPSDYDTVSSLSDAEYRLYKHRETPDTVWSNSNSYGYVLVAFASQQLLPWLGDLEAAIALQAAVHFATSMFLIVAVMQTRFQRVGLLVLYAANPVVLHFVSLPMYYFWMFIPGCALVVLRFRREWTTLTLAIATPLMLFSLWVRPTTLFLAAFVYCLAALQARDLRSRSVVAAAVVVFVLGVSVIYSGGSRALWHTAYTGLGAYENPFGPAGLRDEDSYEFFESQTGVKIDTNAVRGNFNDPLVRGQMDELLKNRYLEIVRTDPLLILRNALLNVLQLFSPGHDPDRPFVTAACTVVGACVLLLLVMAKQWVWILGVLSVSVGYVLYFPPIAAYHFGAYLVLVVGCILAVERLPNLSRARGGPLWRRDPSH